VDDHYRVGQLVEGRVTRVLDFGAFVELDLGVEGLLHTSEMIGTPELPPTEIVHPGETLLVKIIRIESRRRRLALSARQVRRSEWERWVAEQQTAREFEETAAREEAAKAKAEVAASEPVEEEAPVPEVEVSEPVEEEAPVLEGGISKPVEGRDDHRRSDRGRGCTVGGGEYRGRSSRQVGTPGRSASRSGRGSSRIP